MRLILRPISPPRSQPPQKIDPALVSRAYAALERADTPVIYPERTPDNLYTHLLKEFATDEFINFGSKSAEEGLIDIAKATHKSEFEIGLRSVADTLHQLFAGNK